MAKELIEYYEKNFPNVVWTDEPLLSNPIYFWKDYWDADTWIRWHTALKNKWGIDRANEVFIIWWNKVPTVSFTTDYRSFNDKFIKYAKDNGFYAALFGGVLGKVGKVAGSAANATEQVVNSATEVLDTASDTLGFFSKNLKTILIVVVVLIVLGVTIYILAQLKSLKQ